MLMNGVLLGIAASGLCVIAVVRQRCLWNIGFALLAAAFGISSIRRMACTMADLLTQQTLDMLTCGMAAMGVGFVLADSLRRGVLIGRRSLLVSAVFLLLLMSPAPWLWNGQGSDHLSYDQVVQALDQGRNVPAASVRARQLAVALIDRLQVVADTGSHEESAIALRKLRCLKEKLEKVQ